jgi:aminodeoxyfutalosine synthase
MTFASRMLDSLGLADLVAPAERRAPFDRAALERVVAPRNPLAAASLADRARAAASGVEVTHPWTLRVRAPGLVHPLEDATKVAHDLGDVADVPATEMEMLGELPPDAPLAHAVELVRSLVAARPDLPLRALTAGEVDRLAVRERRSRTDVVGVLHGAGVTTLSWRAGCGRTAAELEVHRAAHEVGMRTVATVGYGHAGADTAFLDRLHTWTVLARDTRGFLAAAALPDRTDGASPLEGSAGTSDWLACALVRLAFGDLVGRVSTDWHVVGHKLGATLLAAGADDVVGAQAAARWAPPVGEGPRALSPDRLRAWVIEARRSAVTRDTLFRPAEPRCG